MKRLNSLLSMILLCLFWLPYAQTPFIDDIHYNSASTDAIGNVYAFTYRSNGWFVGVGSANEPCHHQDDTMPVIFKIDPDGNLHNPAVICVDLGTSPKTFITKDIIEHPNGLFILCGKVIYPGASGGSSAFLLIVDTANSAHRLIVYDNMLTANALVYNPVSDYYVMVGQSWQDDMFSLTWDSIPCVLVLDGYDPLQILNSRVVYDWGPGWDNGAFNDVKTVNNKEYYLTGFFRVLEDAYDNASDDILFSVLEIDGFGVIQNSEHILINSNTDLSDERGRRIAINTLNEIYLCGESWDPPSQQNQEKDFAVMKISGNILPGNLINLNYDFREVDFDNEDRDIFATDIDYLASSNAIAVTGQFLADNGEKHPYIFHTLGFFNGQTLASDFYDYMPPNWDASVNRVSILTTSSRTLAFGWWEDDNGESQVMILGDTLYQAGQFNCRNSISPIYTNHSPSLRVIVDAEHNEQPDNYDPVENQNVNLTLNSIVCQAAVFKMEGAEAGNSTVLHTKPEIINLGESIEIKHYQGTFKIFNMMSQLVLEGRVEEGKKLHTTFLVPGMYILLLKESSLSAKFVR